jgi:diguanylate cyclase (GGDEF)-like protein
MNYGTFFFTNIVSVTVFTVSICVLAWRNRSIRGMQWFAAALVTGLTKLILQGCEGRIPAILSSMLANELYLVSFMLQYMGLRWFVLRTPIRRRWPFVLIALALAIYTVTYHLRIIYIGNIINIPFVIVCGASAWMLIRHGKEAFKSVSRATAFVLIGCMLVSGYRAILTNMRYMRPWATVNAHNDPRWLYSLAGMALLATCMVMCFLWFLVVELERELAEQARTDSLTSALNRRAMEEAALRETSRSIRHGYPLCMIVLDIDHFKRLNDTRGHAAGDRALQALVESIRPMLRANDLLARTGGEEFTVLLPDTSAETGVIAAERIRRAIESLEIPFEGTPIRITVSAGVAQLDPSQGGWETMMRRADSAMYEAKERGRNAVCPDLNRIETGNFPPPSGDISTSPAGA